MATRLAILAGSTHSTRKAGLELWDLFLFYLGIFVITVFLAAIVFCFYAAFESAKRGSLTASFVVAGLSLLILAGGLLLHSEIRFKWPARRR